jgi:hypothetical protein
MIGRPDRRRGKSNGTRWRRMGRELEITPVPRWDPLSHILLLQNKTKQINPT